MDVLIFRLEEKGAGARITYKDLASAINERYDGKKLNPHRAFNQALGRIQDVCFKLNLPCLSSMVVLGNGMKPGTGFVSYYRTLHPEAYDRTDEEIAQEEWSKTEACDDWQAMLDFYGIDRKFIGVKNVMAERRAEEEYEENQRIIKTIEKEIKRNSDARKRCLEIKGSTCVVCGFNSKEVYGVPGIIHVHHLHPLSDSLSKKDSVKTNPATDLVPVCPNCHALIHSKKVPYGIREECYSIDEAKAMLDQRLEAD